MKLYQHFNHDCPTEEAASQLEMIPERFVSAEIPVCRDFINLVVHWKEEIINSFDRPAGRKQSNALTENTNQKIRTYLAVSKRQHKLREIQKTYSPLSQ